mmetsp:Transcript_3548/g.10315  ORF Transcript_3548/g.10315 Transcript_3548/m.10315 type:complete len:929 (-) Transcript_3548:2692-5478(-)
MARDIDLLKSDWVLTSGAIEVKGRLPASSLQLLQAAQLVPDILYRYGEREYHWVSEKTWTFRHTFDVSEDFLTQSHVDLLLDGIDTIATISINGHEVLATDNAFRSYSLDAKPHLKAGQNQLQVMIEPASDVGRARHAAYPYDVPVIQQVPKGLLGNDLDEDYNFVRKPACDSGWDWGPKVSQAGIYGPVLLRAYDYPLLTGANVRQVRQKDGSTRLDIQCRVQSTGEGAAGTLAASLPALNLSASQQVVLPSSGECIPAVQVVIPGGTPLWWPRGYGKAVLHDLHISFTPKQSKRPEDGDAGTDAASEGSEGASATVSRVIKRLGLKWVELKQESLGNDGGVGETFKFLVNGMPIFIKGSNVIPSSIYATDETPIKQRSLVAAAAATHQNTLRVWGGGRYPCDAFMEACDEEGMLVWLELMFACALYPVDPAFLDNVSVEVQQQMFRLQGHASVLALGGNNEVENSFPWFPATSQVNPSLYAVDFARLFLDTIRPIVHVTGPDIYVDTSPSNGLYSTDPYVKRWNVADGTREGSSATNDPRFGDVHFYNYSANGFDAMSYPRAKFISEFGWQSFPSWPGLQKCIDPKLDLGCNSAMSEYRQRHPNGQAELLQQISSHFPLGDALESTVSGFRRYIYLTQLHQAMAYDTAVRYWRRIQHEPDAQTSGILYWQLNDIWEGASWSGINRDGSWRLMHHVIGHAYQSFMVCAHLDKSGAIRVWLVNELPHALKGELWLKLVPWASTPDSTQHESMPFEMPAQSVHLALRTDMAQALAPLRLTAAEAFISVFAVANSSEASDTPEQMIHYESTTLVHLTELKHAALREPLLQAHHFKQLSPEAVEFYVTSKAVAAGVAVETFLPGHFSDNAMHIRPEHPKQLCFTSAAGPITAARLQETLTMQSLYTPDGSGSKRSEVASCTDHVGRHPPGP